MKTRFNTFFFGLVTGTTLSGSIYWLRYNNIPQTTNPLANHYTKRIAKIYTNYENCNPNCLVQCLDLIAKQSVLEKRIENATGDRLEILCDQSIQIEQLILKNNTIKMDPQLVYQWSECMKKAYGKRYINELYKLCAMHHPVIYSHYKPLSLMDYLLPVSYLRTKYLDIFNEIVDN